MKYLLLLLICSVVLYAPRTIHAYFTDQKVRFQSVMVGDWVAPEVELTVGEQKIVELIKDGQFADNLQFWQITGNVSKVDDGVKISSEEPSAISQTIDPTKNNHLGFWLKAGTTERLTDFDTPFFTVSLGNQTVYQLSSADLVTHTQNNETEWVFVTVQLPDTDQSGKLEFKVENTGDNLEPSWVLMKGITTQVIAANQLSQIKLTSNESNATACYEINNQTQCAQQPLQFTPSVLEGTTAIDFWTEDTVKNKSQVEILYLNYDVTAPSAVADLQVYPESNGEVSITFTFPGHDLLELPFFAEVRTSQTAINSENEWNDAGFVPFWSHQKLETTPSGSRNNSLIFSSSEDIVIFDTTTEEKYFAVRLRDIAGNKSPISSSAIAE